MESISIFSETDGITLKKKNHEDRSPKESKIANRPTDRLTKINSVK